MNLKMARITTNRTHRQIRLVVTKRQVGDWERGKWRKVVKRYKGPLIR